MDAELRVDAVPPHYTVRPADLGIDGPTFVGLWDGNIGPAGRLAEKFHHFYESCPYGPPVASILEAPDGMSVGVVAIGPRPMRREGRDVAVGVLAHFAVRQDHRSLGPALALVDDVLARARQRFEVIYGMPNAKALPVLRRAGMRVVGSLDRYVRVLRPSNYFARSLTRPLALVAGIVADALVRARDLLRVMATRGLVAEWREQCDARFDALAATTATDSALHSVRDSLFLGWRFDHAPADRPNYLVLMDRRTGALQAWFACAPEPGNCELLGVLDYDSIIPGGRVRRIWLDLLAVHARRRGAAAINAELCVSAAAMADWTAGGFRARDGRSIVMLTRGGTELPESCHFTLVDQDG